MCVSKENLAFNKYEKRFQKFMCKLNKDVNNDPALKKETKKWNVFAGMCHLMRKDISKFLRSCKA